MTFGPNWHFDLIQGSEAWLAHRVGKVTASMVSDIFAEGTGKSRENALADLVCELLTGQSASDGFKSAAMQRGNELEPLARVTYEAQTGNEVQVVGFVDHPTMGHYGASPDGFFETVSELVGLELKCRSNAIHIAILNGKPIPKKDFDQMICQMDCMGASAVDYGSFNPNFPDGMKLLVRRVYRDEKEIVARRIKIQAFIDEALETVAKLREKFK